MTRKAYNKKLLFNTIFLVIFAIIFTVSLGIANSYNKKIDVNYSSKGDINYKVNLKENKYYNDEITNDMDYLSSLIETIDFDYDYQFLMDESFDLEYTYYVTADINVYNNENGKSIYNKKYNITKPITKKVMKSKSFNIKDSFNFDFVEYNSFVNKFKQDYNLFSSADATLKLNVMINTIDDAIENPVHIEKEALVKVPLSEQLVTIKKDFSKLNDNGTIITYSNENTLNKVTLIIAMVSGLLAVVFMDKLIYLILKVRLGKSKYQKKRDKILKEYDRVISNTKDEIMISDKSTVTEIYSFEELLDIRDNLNLPILYHEDKKNIESTFVIKHFDEVYLYKLKEKDFKDEKSKK